VLYLDCALKLQPTDADFARLASTHLGLSSCIAGAFARNAYGPLERKQANNNIANSGLGHKEVHAVEFAKEFRAMVGTNPFAGGQAPGTADLSFYGILA
jgi:hypothetical protein